MRVASGASITRTISSSMRDGNSSNSRRPPPKSTGSDGSAARPAHTFLERPLRRVRTMHQHVPVPGGGLRLRHRAGDPIGHVRHQRIVRDGRAGRPVTGYEDRDTVRITAPVIDLLRGTPTRQHRAGRVPLVPELSGRPGRRPELPVRSDDPLVQPTEAVAAGVARFVVRTGDVSVEGHRHVEHRCRHFDLLWSR